MTGNKIISTPADEALWAFDQANNVEPARTIAERIAWRFDFRPDHMIVDDISEAIEDAVELGQRRAAYLPKKKGNE